MGLVKKKFPSNLLSIKGTDNTQQINMLSDISQYLLPTNNACVVVSYLDTCFILL